jgi:hypothetical protein
MKTIILLALLLLSLNSFSQKTTYRVVVKFGSMCCGVPSDKPLLNYIASFKKKNKIKKIVCYKIGPMGREGEYDMAFSLKELKQKQIELFVKEITSLATTMKEQGYVNVEENLEIDTATIGRATIDKKSL